MRTVLVANRKGGVGKTLISVTLASALANRSKKVALADADKQRSSIEWLHRRPALARRITGLDWSSDSHIGEAPKKIEWLVIDAPGAVKGARVERLISEAHAVLCPVQPSFFDSASTASFLEQIDEIKRVRKGRVGVHMVMNRIRPNSKAKRELEEFLKGIGREPLAWLSERAAYGEYAAEGLGIFDRDLKALDPLKEQWTPILNAIDA